MEEKLRLPNIKKLGEEYLKIVKERDVLEAKRKEIAKELMKLLSESNQKKVDFGLFEIKIKDRMRVTGWRWEEINSVFGEDKANDMLIRDVDRKKLRAAIEELRHMGIELSEDQFAIKEKLSEYVEVKPKRKNAKK